MKHIMIALDDKLLERAEVVAAERGTTVDALVQDFLAKIAHEPTIEERAGAPQKLVELSEKSKGRLGPGWKWNREELYDREALRRHECIRVRGDGERSAGGKETPGE